MSAIETIVWALLVMIGGLGLAAASWRASPAPLGPSTAAPPYRSPETPPATPAPEPRGGWVIAGGVLELALVPVWLFVALARSFSLAGTANDTAGSVLMAAAAAASVLVGPARIVTGVRMRRGQPTSRVIAAALDTFLGVLVAAAVFVAVGDVARMVIAGAAAVLTFAGWSALAWVNVLPVPRSDEPGWRTLTRSRLALASLYAALVNGLASASTLWIAGELGDRLSNHRTPDGDAW